MTQGTPSSQAHGDIIPAWDEELMQAARSASGNAHAPYSRFAVGAAVRLADGTIFCGANMENASYGLSLCAETVAIAAANAAGKMADIIALAVVGGAMDGGAVLPPLTPCGRCRQIIAEAASLAGRTIPVYCASLSGDERAVYNSADLLPHAFSAAALAERAMNER